MCNQYFQSSPSVFDRNSMTELSHDLVSYFTPVHPSHRLHPTPTLPPTPIYYIYTQVYVTNILGGHPPDPNIYINY